MEFISKQWEEHRSQKDKEKNDRVSDQIGNTDSCNYFNNKVIKTSLCIPDVQESRQHSV